MVLCALALLGGMVGAGFASGREIARFFSSHGPASGAAVLMALAVLYALFMRLSSLMARTGCPSLTALCRLRFGRGLGLICGALFALLQAVTGGAMLAACAELCALVVPLPHSYGMGLAFSLLLGALLAYAGAAGLAAPGLAIAALLPVLMVRLLALPLGEACFFPAMAPDLPVRAAADGLLYGALNAAMLGGMMPLLARLKRPRRRYASLLFTLLFGALLLLGAAVCRRHLQAVWNQPMPFVYLARQLGRGGYLLVASCLFAAALSTLCAMLSSLARVFPVRRGAAHALSALCLVPFARMGFGPIVSCGYPVLGALCAALLGLLCLPTAQAASPSSR